MTPIRPGPAPLPQTSAARPSVDARAAFFQAALGKAEAPLAATPAAAAPAPAPVQVTQAEPEKFRRPGSLLDIRV